MSEDDPFEDLDVPEDREGDPFERLSDVGPPEDDGTDASADEQAGDDSDHPDESSLFTSETNTAAADASGGDEAAEPDIFTAESEPDGAESDKGERATPSDDGDTAEGPEFEEEFIEDDTPFERLDDRTAASDDETQRDPAVEDDDPALEAELFDEGDTEAADDPFTEMAARDGDPFGSGESVFESVDIEGIDPDDVWESLERDETDEPAFHTSRYTDVSKHRFCEQCEFFASPPAASCTHDEAEIIEYLDMETVRLLNCPIVAEQRELENEE